MSIDKSNIGIAQIKTNFFDLFAIFFSPSMMLFVRIDSRSTADFSSFLFIFLQWSENSGEKIGRWPHRMLQERIGIYMLKSAEELVTTALFNGQPTPIFNLPSVHSAMSAIYVDTSYQF